MCEQQDIEARRAQDLKRWHRRVAERRASGTCIRCGKRPPEPHRSDCEPCAEKRRKADLERHHRRTAERTALGLCPRCGKQPPAPERFLCEPCGEKRNRASRARDARLRAAGLPRRDAERARAYERDRSRREADIRREAGLCTRCGKQPAAEGRASLRALPGEEAGFGPREIRRREGGGEAVRRGRSRGQKACRPGPEQAPPEGSDRSGPLYPLRQAAPCRGWNHLPALPRQTPGGGAPEILRPAPGRALHPVRSAGDRRSLALRSLCRHRGSQPRPGAEERAFAQALRRTEGQGLVYILRGAVPGGQQVRPVRREIVSRLGAFQGHPGLGPDLDGDRGGHRPRARAVRRSGRHCSLSRLREARPRARRGAVRRTVNGLDHRLDLSRRPAAQPARRPPGTCCRPALRRRPYISPAGRPPLRQAQQRSIHR